ncbi:hypothetical protein Nepgr_013805 [Nepenthes gracilis]|uniref:Uncharacterized protein n=1 Tax=Nepenthes gracilis TaxID=150966 RepID=A0AAD3SJJ8_NEPGR|nr:hypothetical protein Nepgr_013805 [Nepenthes gracilis]
MTLICSYMELNTSEFNLGEAIDAIMSQVMALSQEQQVPVIHDSTHEVFSTYLIEENLKLQQLLSDFLTKVVHFTLAFGGLLIVFTVLPRKEHFGKKIEVVHVEFR